MECGNSLPLFPSDQSCPQHETAHSGIAPTSRRTPHRSILRVPRVGRRSPTAHFTGPKVFPAQFKTCGLRKRRGLETDAEPSWSLLLDGTVGIAENRVPSTRPRAPDFTGRTVLLRRINLESTVHIAKNSYPWISG